MPAKNGYYGSLVPMVRDAFLSCELVRIDCQGLEKSDYKKIGCKLRVMVISLMPLHNCPCVLKSKKQMKKESISSRSVVLHIYLGAREWVGSGI